MHLKTKVERRDKHTLEFLCPGCGGRVRIKHSTGAGSCAQCESSFHFSEAPDSPEGEEASVLWEHVTAIPSEPGSDVLVRVVLDGRHGVYTCPRCWSQARFDFRMHTGACDHCGTSLVYVGDTYRHDAAAAPLPVYLIRLVVERDDGQEPPY